MVKDRNGVELGRIFDLVIGSKGEVEFAIVNQVFPPDTDDYEFAHVVAVPFSVLTVSKGTSQELLVVFNADKEKFYEAPEAPSSFFSSGGRVNSEKVAEINKYFGVQPYWTYPYYPW